MQTDVAWAAGFFDGEGYVGLVKGNGSYRRLQASVAQVDKRPLDKFLSAVGVGEVRGPYGPYSTTRQPYWQYMVHGSGVRVLYELLAPFLSLKQDRFKAAIEADDVKEKLACM